jgi:hypothetical protein
MLTVCRSQAATSLERGAGAEPALRAAQAARFHWMVRVGPGGAGGSRLLLCETRAAVAALPVGNAQRLIGAFCALAWLMNQPLMAGAGSD